MTSFATSAVLTLFNCGCDTLTIAKKFGIRECDVWNLFARLDHAGENLPPKLANVKPSGGGPLADPSMHAASALSVLSHGQQSMENSADARRIRHKTLAPKKK